MAKKSNKATEESLEKQLWKSADKLRKNIDAAEYKHVVLGLIFLKYISDSFEELYDKLKKEEHLGADPEDKDEYNGENVFFVPPTARGSYLLSVAKQPTIGKHLDNAMIAIEKENNSLKDVLPKVYGRQNLDPTSLGELIDLIGNIALGDVKSRSADVLFPRRIRLSRRQKRRSVLYSTQCSRIIGRDDRTFPRTPVRPLLWLGGNVCTIRKIRFCTPGTGP